MPKQVNREIDLFDDDVHRRAKRRQRSLRRAKRSWIHLPQRIYVLGHWFKRCRRYFAMRTVRQSEAERREECVSNFFGRILGLFKLLIAVQLYFVGLMILWFVFSDILPSPLTILSFFDVFYIMLVV